MVENRSFDHLFGFFDLDGVDPLLPNEHPDPVDACDPASDVETPGSSGAHLLAFGPPHTTNPRNNKPRRRGASRLAPARSCTNSVVAMPAPHWFFRFMYDRESAAWERQRDMPEQRKGVERTADELAKVVAPPGPVVDLGCGPGAHALALARRGYDVVGVDGSPRMVEVARTRAARDKVDATFDVHDVSAPLRFADASLGGVLAILVLQHLPHPAALIAEIRRCLRPGGHLLITAPARDGTSLTSQNLYWRLRAACYHHVPGVVRFYDTSSLSHLIEDQGLTVVECNGEPLRVSVLARA
jgi:SAM-dependent methyltransferase